MTSPSVFAAKCQRMATVIPRAQQRANTQVARAIKPVWFGQAGLTPASRIAGGKVGIRDSTTGVGNVTTLIRWTGAVHLVEGPTKAHPIAARRVAGSRRRRGSRALAFGGNVRLRVRHPGTAGRGFWPQNKASARVVATTVYRQSALPSILREAGFS